MKKILLALSLFISLGLSAQNFLPNNTMRDTLVDYNVSGVIAINTDLAVPATWPSGIIDCGAFQSLSATVNSVGTGGAISVQWSNYPDMSGFFSYSFYDNVNAKYTTTLSSVGSYIISRRAKYCRIRLTTATSAGTTTLKVFGSNVIPFDPYITAYSTIQGLVSGDFTNSTITSTQTGSQIFLENYQSSSWELNVTAASGTTPTLDVILQESNGVSLWKDLYHFPRFTTTGYFMTPALKTNGRTFRYVRNVSGTTPSFTMTISRYNKGVIGSPVYQFFDYAIVPNTLNSTTAAFNIAGATQLSVKYISGTATATCWLQTQISNDGTNWQNIDRPIQTQASATTQISNGQISTSYARVIVTYAGSAQTGNISINAQ